jgi:hypothetical protein
MRIDTIKRDEPRKVEPITKTDKLRPDDKRNFDPYDKKYPNKERQREEAKQRTFRELLEVVMNNSSKEKDDFGQKP